MSKRYTDVQIDQVVQLLMQAIQSGPKAVDRFNLTGLRSEIVDQLGFQLHHHFLSENDDEIVDWLCDLVHYVITMQAWNDWNESAAYSWPNLFNTEPVEATIERNFKRAAEGFNHVIGSDDDYFDVDYYEPNTQHRSPVAKTWLSGRKVFENLNLNPKGLYVTGRISQSGKTVIFNIPQCDKDDLDKLGHYYWLPVTKTLVRIYVEQILRPQNILNHKYMFNWFQEADRDDAAMQAVTNQLEV